MDKARKIVRLIKRYVDRKRMCKLCIYTRKVDRGMWRYVDTVES